MVGEMPRLSSNRSNRVRPSMASRKMRMLHHSPTRSRLRATGHCIFAEALSSHGGMLCEVTTMMQVNSGITPMRKRHGSGTFVTRQGGVTSGGVYEIMSYESGIDRPYPARPLMFPVLLRLPLLSPRGRRLGRGAICYSRNL